MEQSKWDTTEWTWFLVVLFFLAITCLIVIFVPLDEHIGLALTSCFAALCAVTFLAMYTTYLSAGKSQSVHKHQPKSLGQTFPARAGMLLIGFAIISLLKWLGEYNPKIATFALAGIGFLVGAGQFAWCFRIFRKLKPQDKDLREKRHVFISLSALAGISILGILGVFLRLALLYP